MLMEPLAYLYVPRIIIIFSRTFCIPLKSQNLNFPTFQLWHSHMQRGPKYEIKLTTHLSTQRKLNSFWGPSRSENRHSLNELKQGRRESCSRRPSWSEWNCGLDCGRKNLNQSFVKSFSYLDKPIWASIITHPRLRLCQALDLVAEPLGVRLKVWVWDLAQSSCEPGRRWKLTKPKLKCCGQGKWDSQSFQVCMLSHSWAWVPGKAEKVVIPNRISKYLSKSTHLLRLGITWDEIVRETFCQRTMRCDGEMRHCLIFIGSSNLLIVIEIRFSDKDKLGWNVKKSPTKTRIRLKGGTSKLGVRISIFPNNT